MDSARPGNPKKLLTLRQTAQKLAVSLDTLLLWNKQNVLKPVISQDGHIGYTEEQINQFIKKRQPLQVKETEKKIFTQRGNSSPESFQKINVYRKFLRWLGNGFYTEEYIKDCF